MSPLSWRFAVLGGLTGGLAAAPFAGVHGPSLAVGGFALFAGVALALTRPRRPTILWPASLALAAALLGLAVGAARLAAIDGGALDLPAGREVALRGFVTAAPWRSEGQVAVRVQTGDGRLMLRSPEPVPDLGAGVAVRAAGTIRDPPRWQRGWFERLAIRDVLATGRIDVVAGTRPGLPGLLDQVRRRGEDALARGTEPEATALLRGFVLGEDDRIDERVRHDFERSGLAHLLAVSGQNVILLALLAAALLGALGVSLRARLLWTLAVIAVYVPVAGGGASIQRAGVMGAAGIIAALADRPRSRWYALLLAAAATLAVDPRASADIGWQLSFAAVVGILVAAGPLAAATGARAGGWRRAVAEGLALTVAATLATAPLMAFHFGAISVVALPANLAALPAEAPVMWLGMLAAALGQIPALPVEPATWLAGAFAGYIAAVAHSFAAPDWAQATLGLPGHGALFASYTALAALALVALRTRRRWQGIGRLRLRLVAPAGALALVVALAAAIPGERAGGDRAFGLRITVLDVGQGDATLLEPAGSPAVLVDTGPPEAEVATQLEAHGIERLGAVVITHPQLDHQGGLAAILERLPVERLVFARLGGPLRALGRARGVDLVRVAAGGQLRSGSLRLDVLWPPRERLTAAARREPNLSALVLRATWRGFDALLTADAEAEAAQVDPGEVEVLKVAHHGSEDAGLPELLRRTEPQLAVISVGAGNPYGHPAPATLDTLAAAGVPVWRTDSQGPIAIEVRRDGWNVR